MDTLYKVKIKKGTRMQLSAEFRVNLVTVSYALSGITNSERAKNIRKRAVALGGDPIYK